MQQVGCAAQQAAPTPPPVDEGLAAELPSGAEAVVSVDVTQLRSWPGTARLRPALARLDALGFRFVDDADQAALAATGLGTDGQAATLLARGRFDRDRLRRACAGEREAIDYHGRPVVDGGAGAIAFLDDKTVAISSAPSEARRAIDVALGGDEPLSRDRALASLLARLPTAKEGRPLAIGVIRVEPALAVALEKQGLTAPLKWAGAAVAVGDGVDVGVVGGAGDERGAAALHAWLRAELDSLRARPSLRALGLARFVDFVRTAARRDEVHLAFRLDQRRLDLLLDRAARLGAAAEAAR